MLALIEGLAGQFPQVRDLCEQMGFDPRSARAALSKAAVLAGADALLAYWPARKELRWIPEADWPASTRTENQ